MSKNIDRREFLKASGTVAATSVLAGCGMKAGSKDEGLDAAGHHTTPVPTGKMTYRTNPKTGEKVSILGYGWMRLPTIKGGSDVLRRILSRMNWTRRKSIVSVSMPLTME